MNAIIAFYIIGVALSLLLNLLVIAVYVNKRSKVNHLELLLVSLAVSDFLQAGLGYPLEIHSTIHDTALKGLSCKFVGFSVTFLGLVSISHLVGISIERLIILRYPWKARVWAKNKWMSLYVIIPSWAYGFLWALMPLVGWSSYSPEQDARHRCSINFASDNPQSQSYSYSLLVSCFIVPLTVIIFCSIFIQKELKKMRNNALPLGMGEAVAEERREVERRNSAMVFILIITFFIAWSPYAICVLMLSITRNVPSKLLEFSAIFAKSSTLYNPIIYSICLKDFRLSCRSLFRIPQPRVGPIISAMRN